MYYQTEQTNCEKSKILLKDKARDKYRDLSDEEERIKREHGRNRYHNMSKEKKQKLKEYRKKYRQVKKSQSNN